MTKKELRQQIKQLKAMTPVAVRKVEADMVFNTIKAMPVWQQVQHILCYWSLPDELPTHEAVNQWLAEGKNIYLPRVKGDDLEIVPYHGAQSLDDNNKFHIGEPVGDAVDASCLELIIVDGNMILIVALILIEGVVLINHDRPLDCIVTSDTVICDENKKGQFA